MYYIEVALFKKIGDYDQTLTYKTSVSVSIGKFVRVPFRNRTYLGVILAISVTNPTSLDESKIKAIELIIETPFLSEESVKTARFIANYYKTSVTRAIKLFIPQNFWLGRIASPKESCLRESCLSELADFDKDLSSYQRTALESIQKSNKPTLLYGVTGSGKTEVYLRLIHDAIKNKKQAILLVPEIALTPQTVEYFDAMFGSRVAIFHSKLTNKKRSDTWWRVFTGGASLVIGSRSAIFAPVKNLGVLIIDEEHEWTYKQESNPYYQTRCVAEELCSLYGAKLILGSATPSVESMYKVKKGDYNLFRLTERINESPLPDIRVVDLREEFKKRNFSIFSELLQRKIEQRLQDKEQIILFVNQRGLASAVVCRDCGLTESCPNCDISLKYHRGSPDKLMCHYCTYTKSPSIVCPNCKSPHIKFTGIGTQRVEEEFKKLYPNARVVRADRDTTKNADGFADIYRDFKKGDYDVLVGTQMIAKGLDFENVSLIGLVLADVCLHIPDFRSAERLFQIIVQVAGRCGRGKAKGEVILQTYNPDNFVIQLSSSYDYDSFITDELKHRKRFNYPPFKRMIKFTVVGSDQNKLKKHIESEQEVLEDIFSSNKLDVSILSAPALVSKMNGRYYYNVLLRSENPDIVFTYWKVPKSWRVDIDPIHTT